LDDFRFWLTSSGGAFRDALLATRVWPAGEGAAGEATARTLSDVLRDADAGRAAAG
jgi:hypothetical protein